MLQVELHVVGSSWRKRRKPVLLMASQGNNVDMQELLDASILQGPDKQQMVSRAINHSFGRGGWRARAEKVVLPRIALESVIKQCGGESWSDQGRGQGPRSDQRERKESCGGGGSQGKGEGPMLCDVGRASVKPRAIGRARALQMRAEMCILPPRRPGRLPGQAAQRHSTTTFTPPPKPCGVPSSCGGGMPTGGQERRMGAINVETPEEYKRRWLEWRQSDSVSETNSLDSSSSQFGVDLVREKPVSTHKHYTLDRKEQLDWVPDANTLCFSNLPVTTTVKELWDAIAAFGNVTHCSIMGHLNEADLATAYIRMEERSSCHWVISCFHGNPFEDSSLPLVVYFATQGQDTV